MKTHTNEIAVDVSTEQVAEFRSTNSAKVMSMLIRRLYTNIPQSISREIMCNARDAHADAGIVDTPFDLVFPSRFDPTFRVRDYGISMDHKTVMELYTDLGHSTKEDSNVGVGKWGIGSKTPFAYADTFTVVTYLDGVKRLYTAIWGNGVPQIHLMGTMETVEPNGVEVSFPIERHDIAKFCEAINRVSYGFDVKPRVVRLADPQDVEKGYVEDEHFAGWPELDVLSEGTGWKILKKHIEGYSGRAYAKMGPVLYPIDASLLEGVDHDVRRMLAQNSVILEFGIGDLEITPSRETLDYGKEGPTIPAIATKLANIIEEMVKKILADFKTCETYWDACAKFGSVRSAGLPLFLLNAVERRATWKGMPLSVRIEVLEREYKGLTFGQITGSRIMNTVYKFSDDTSVNVYPSKHTIVVIEDMSISPKEKRVAGRIRKFSTDRRADQKSTHVNEIIWVRFWGTRSSAQSMVNLLELLDGAEIITANELPDLPKSTAQRRPVQVRELRYGSFDNRVELSEEDFEAGGYYVPLERMEPVRPQGYGAPDRAYDLLTAWKVIPHGTRIYGAPKSMWDKFEGPQWVNIYDELGKLFKKHAHRAADVALHKGLNQVTRDRTFTFISEQVSMRKLATNSPLKLAVEEFNTICAMTKPDIHNLEDLFVSTGNGDKLQGDADNHPVVVSVAALTARIHAAYPMMAGLEKLGRWGNDKVLDNVTHYVQVCDQANKNTNQANDKTNQAASAA